MCHIVIADFVSWVVAYVLKGRRQVSIKVRDITLEVTGWITQRASNGPDVLRYGIVAVTCEGVA